MPPPKDSPLPNALAHESDYWTSTVHNETYPAISPLKTDMKGRAVFVSGASRGLGHAIALSFARAGASYIALGARSDLSAVEKAIEAAAVEAKRDPPEIVSLKFDMSSRESVEDAARQIEKMFGRLDIVVNNAATIGRIAPVAESDPDVWWDTWTTNVRGPYYIVRSLLPLLLKSQNGAKVIVNVSSVGAHLVGPGFSAYQSTKLALLRFTEFVQAEYRNQGVVTFSLHPGNMVTYMLDGIGGVPKGLEHGKHPSLRVRD